MPDPIQGIHHITAIASTPQRNLDFYTQVLGLRLVKLTVNFDDPGTYHFYFGDEAGHPGTILTFFPWVGMTRGRRGQGQAAVVSFNITRSALGFWQDRLNRHNVAVSTPFTRFDDEVLSLVDPDGLHLELVGSDLPQPLPVTGAAAAPSRAGAGHAPAYPVVASMYAIRGFAAPTLLPSGFEQTAALLTDVFGMRQVQQAGQRYRFSAPDAALAGAQVDIEVRPNETGGRLGAGIVHHIAWRTPDELSQLEWRETLVNLGLNVTPVMDRQYFRSIYFREPGGILFEIATDPPGFATDEPLSALGTGLRLPPWLEPKREVIQRTLPPLQLPDEQDIPL